MLGPVGFVGRPTTHRSAAVGAAVVPGVCLTLAFMLDANESPHKPWTRVSSIVWAISSACWAVRMIPQALLNHQRKSTEGLSRVGVVIGLASLVSLSVFNLVIYCSERGHETDTAHSDGYLTKAELQDVFCSLLATTATAVTVAQCYTYPPRSCRVTRATKLTIRGAFVIATAIAAGVGLGMFFHLASFQKHLSVLELGTTVAMHAPQLLLNLRRKSTTGWSVHSVHLDTCHRLLSTWLIAWIIVTDSPAKLLLAAVGLSVNGVYMVQHYVWYASEIAGHEALPLLTKQQPPASAKVAPIARHEPPSWLTLVALHGTDGLALDNAFWLASAELRRV